MDANCTSCHSFSDNSLWLLLIAFALSGKEFRLDDLFASENLPVMLALLYCMCKSGCLSSLLEDILKIFGCNENNDRHSGNCDDPCNNGSGFGRYCNCNG